MKRLLTLFAFVLLALTGTGQSKTFHGIVQDFYTLKRINKVYIGAEYGDSLAVTDKKGRFKIILPKFYKKTIRFTHPGYYPLYLKVKKLGDPHPLPVYMIPLSIKLDTVIQYTSEGNKLIRGTVYDSNSEQPVAGVNIETANHRVIAVTNPQGIFFTGIPANSRQFMATHPEYKPLQINLNPKKKREGFSLILTRKKYSRADTAWKTYKNEISVIPNELGQSAIGIRYHRFLRFRHAAGVRFTWYFHGVGVTMYIPSSEYTGIKLSPFYRYYITRTIRRSFFAEGKLSVGRFDFSKLYYGYLSDARYGEFFNESFLSYGFGLGVGYSVILPKTKHGIISFYSGFRYFPTQVEQYKSSEHYGSLGVVDGWWYFYGPGSIIEFKVAVGGIF